jgi:hypothetical protein
MKFTWPIAHYFTFNIKPTWDIETQLLYKTTKMAEMISTLIKKYIKITIKF